MEKPPKNHPQIDPENYPEKDEKKREREVSGQNQKSPPKTLARVNIIYQTN